MQQLALDLPKQRRIDVTFERLDHLVQNLTDAQRAKMSTERWFALLSVASRLRSMELSEEAAMGGNRSHLADDYDRLVEPGEDAVAAILRVLAHHLR